MRQTLQYVFVLKKLAKFPSLQPLRHRISTDHRRYSSSVICLLNWTIGQHAQVVADGNARSGKDDRGPRYLSIGALIQADV